MCRRRSRVKGPLPKGLLIDNLGHCALVVCALTYLVFFFAAVGVGVNGPKTFASAANPAANLRQDCMGPSADAASCRVQWYGVLTDMSPLHQYMWLTMTQTRPVVTSTNQPALNYLDVSWDAVYQIDVVGVQPDGTNVLLAQNQTHVVHMHWSPYAAQSDGAVLFVTAEIRYTVFRITVRFINALGQFASAVTVNPTVNMNIVMSFVNKEYTNFELGWKMFFVVTSALLFIMYSALLCCGPSTKDEETNTIQLPSTIEQAYVWWLGLMLIFFNDPLFQIEIESPSIVTSGWTAFCTVSYLATLFMFWLVLFDISRLQGEGGITWHMSSERSNDLGACFWVPKVVFLTIFWTISLAGFMYLRMSMFSDPSFNLVGDVSKWPVLSWFISCVQGLVGFYIVYLFALLVLSLRNFRTLRPGARFFVCITIVTIIVMLTGLYLNVYTPMQSTAAAFLSVYAAANLYTWWLMLAYTPGPRMPQWFADLVTDAPREDLEAVDTTGALGRRKDGADAEEEIDMEDIVVSRPSRRNAARREVFTISGDDDDDDDDDRHDDNFGRSRSKQSQAAEVAAAAAAAAVAAISAMRNDDRRGSRNNERSSSRSGADRAEGGRRGERSSGTNGGTGTTSSSARATAARAAASVAAPPPPPADAGGNIVSLYGPNGEEVLRAVAYQTNDGEQFFIGEDGLGFVLDEQGIPHYLSEEDQAAVSGLPAPPPAAPPPPSGAPPTAAPTNVEPSRSQRVRFADDGGHNASAVLAPADDEETEVTAIESAKAVAAPIAAADSASARGLGAAPGPKKQQKGAPAGGGGNPFATVSAAPPQTEAPAPPASSTPPSTPPPETSA